MSPEKALDSDNSAPVREIMALPAWPSAQSSPRTLGPEELGAGDEGVPRVFRQPAANSVQVSARRLESGERRTPQGCGPASCRPAADSVNLRLDSEIGQPQVVPMNG